MKKTYTAPEAQCTVLSSADVIQSSAILLQEINLHD